ncbi:unnamed protein product [Mytilus coruscus]|uniref:Uncharacterized protein n=1 Tax=Mytilus coruscus TaxID=42192 RepID=A0A6J8CRJ7_MYTCO|nr:unnamed protein product [Mytilus coruscus]
MDSNPKYQAFLPEFLVLHLRKSKITNLISAYKDSGLIHILQYMKYDENEKDWAKLLTIANIETETRNIWTLSTAIHVTLCISFLKSLPKNEAQTLLRFFESSSSTQTFDDQFGNKFEKLLKVSCEHNATFCLHHEIMVHCDEIVAIGISERIGGKDGHNLLLASVKSSLPF